MGLPRIRRMLPTGMHLLISSHIRDEDTTYVCIPYFDFSQFWMEDHDVRSGLVDKEITCNCLLRCTGERIGQSLSRYQWETSKDG